MDEFNQNYENTELVGGTIYDRELNSEMRTSFLDYAMSVITSRALPDVRDGLKPVHRRILYTMDENGLAPNKAYRKCADTVGSVLGRYHPHGDASVYDAMVRMAQDFSMRYVLVDGHGNFGSIDGDPPAAYRYTESRMSRISLEMLRDIDKETVDFIPNYDDRLKEPTVLPSRYPNLLVNGSTGIAVGMATNIPPHNLGEVIDAICLLIDDPEADLEKLMTCIKGPDFPTSGIIMGRAGIRAAYATGRGKIRIRSKTEIVEGHGNRTQIVVTELPYGVNKKRLIERIAELVKDKKLEGIADINDYSNREGIRMVIDLKREANPNIVLNSLFQFTDLQSSYGIIMLALVDGVPKILTLKQVLREYIKHQKEIILRRTQFDLQKARRRQHILLGLKTALDYLDEIIEILRRCKSPAEGKEKLCERFDIDDEQAQAIVEMRLGQLTNLEQIKIEEELAALIEKIAELSAIISDDEHIYAVVKEELEEIKRKFGDERRTQIESVSGEVDIEDLIPNDQSVFTFTQMGYLKRQTADTYQAQRKNGKGIKGLARRDEDVTKTVFSAKNHDHIMFFTTKGKVFRLKGWEIPEGSRQSKGTNVVNLLQIDNDEKVSVMMKVPEIREGEEYYLIFATKNGVIKRTELSMYRHIRRSGLIAINLDDDDELVRVTITKGNEEVFVATRNGLGIRFNENQARSIGRTARGVKAINLAKDDEVVGLCTIDPDDENRPTVLTVSESGIGRRNDISEFTIQSRGGKGKINYKTDKYGKVAAVVPVTDEDDLILMSSDGIVIRIAVDTIKISGRTTRGVNLMKVNSGEIVVSAVTVMKENEPEQEEEESSDES